ncbi:hypothetical protein Clacol_010082 [Clathrus columnatus]|uniref:P-loop containing nucleoside triphosphate hydrolase protein n=1 Tax=Clathrus columnatus TaxID=1419009 RepID=A0AAV5ASS9_9AGAM|nr:hypothetical protein Clacol_010082 [Clathrus columnatus]
MSSKPKVICLGLGQTGTSSLMDALEMLGFGPCYHMKVVLQNQDPNEIKTWTDLGQGNVTSDIVAVGLEPICRLGSTTLDDIRTLLKDYNSIVDYPPAIYYEELYKAYPDAKFILTTREPVKWEASSGCENFSTYS